MGNRISIAQDERDEAEYWNLVRAVESAQRQPASSDQDSVASLARSGSYCPTVDPPSWRMYHGNDSKPSTCFSNLPLPAPLSLDPAPPIIIQAPIACYLGSPEVIRPPGSPPLPDCDSDRPQIVRIGSRTSLSVIDGDSKPDRPHVVRVGSPDRCMASPIVDDSDQVLYEPRPSSPSRIVPSSFEEDPIVTRCSGQDNEGSPGPIIVRASSPALYRPQATEHSRRHFPPSPESPIRLYNTGLSSRSSSRSPEIMTRPPAPSGPSVSSAFPQSGSWREVVPGGRADESIRRGRSRSRSSRGTGGFEDIVAPPSPQCCRIVLPSSRSRSGSRTTRTPSPGLAVRRNGSPHSGLVREHQSPTVIYVPPSPPKITTDSTRLHAELIRELHTVSREMSQSHSEMLRVVQERDTQLIQLLRAMNGSHDRKLITTRQRSPSIQRVTGQALMDVEASDDKRPYENVDRAPLQAYPNIPYAAGLRLTTEDQLARDLPTWAPAWKVFPLKVFRGSDFKYLKIQANWDDEMLLRELNKTYDRLRTIWRKWFSLRNVSSITMVLADHSFVYPQRLGPAGVSPAKNLRVRYILAHPHCMKARHEFMKVLTARTDVGIEFTERFQLRRIAIAVILPVLASIIVGVLYSVFTGDVSSGFTISGYMTSAYSVCLVLVGILNLVES